MKKQFLSLALCILMLTTCLSPTVAFATDGAADASTDQTEQTASEQSSSESAAPPAEDELPGDEEGETEPVDPDLLPDLGLEADSDSSGDTSSRPASASTNMQVRDLSISHVIADADNHPVTSRLEPGNTYKVQVLFYDADSASLHGAALSLNTNAGSTATSQSYAMQIMADNLSVGSKNYSSYTIFMNLEKSTTVSYVPGSAKFSSAAQPSGVALNDLELFSRDIGVMIGYSAMDGELPAGRSYVCQLDFEVKVDYKETSSNSANGSGANSEQKDSNNATTSDEHPNDDTSTDHANENTPTGSPEGNNPTAESQPAASKSSNKPFVALCVINAILWLSVVYFMWHISRHLGVKYPLLNRISAACRILRDEPAPDSARADAETPPSDDVDGKSDT